MCVKAEAQPFGPHTSSGVSLIHSLIGPSKKLDSVPTECRKEEGSELARFFVIH